jgi:hypothetical protein
VFAAPVVFVAIILSVYFIGVSQAREFVRIGINKLNNNFGSINYLESKYSLAARIQHDWSISGNKVHNLCLSISNNFTLNKLKLRNECLKKEDSETLFFLTGDSHAEHFATMLDSSAIIRNLYFSQLSSCHFIGSDHCPEREWYKRKANATSGRPDEKSAQVNNLLDDFRKIYYVISMRLIPGYQKHPEAVEGNLTNYIQSIDKDIDVILIAPTPEFENAPSKCLITDDKYCVLDKEIDLRRRSKLFTFYHRLQKQFANVYLYDPYHELCPGKNCIMYDQAKDLLIAMDTTHLSVEGSRYLAPHFDDWIRQTFGL